MRNHLNLHEKKLSKTVRIKLFTPLELSDSQIVSMFSAITDGGVAINSALGGRGYSYPVEDFGCGPLFVKSYRRGGLFGKFISSHYLRFGETRAMSEFNLLRKVNSININIPEPIAYAYSSSILTGNCIYKNWLITREVEGAYNLAELCKVDLKLAISKTHEFMISLNQLIKHKLLHVDLHPGNVLVCPEGRIYILDFDKARQFRGSVKQLKDWYLRRWRRAVIKHKLPEALSEVVCLKLRMVSKI